MKSRNIIFTIACFAWLSPVFAQDINRELILVRPYEPSVTDAQKITTLPNLKDSFSIKPLFEYSIRSRRIDTRFDVSPIAPAKLQPLPQSKLYHGYIKVGAGFKPNAMAEVALNTVRNKDYAAGAILKLSGAKSKVKFDNDSVESVPAGYNNASAKVFAQKFFHNAILYSELGASRQKSNHYGYDTKSGTPVDIIGDIPRYYIFADANIGIRSSHFKTEKLNYIVQLSYKNANNRLDTMYVSMLPAYIPEPNSKSFVRDNENAFNFKTQVDNNMFGGNLNFDIYNRKFAFDSLRNNFIIDINPWFMLDNDSVRLQVGMRIAAYNDDGNIHPYIFPKIEFQFTLLKDIFIPFVGIDGYFRPNTYRDIVTENPFVMPGISAPITKTKYQIYAGLKGTLTSKLSYYLRADYFDSSNEYFFVNDTSTRLQKYFTVISDDIQYVSLKGELYFNPVESVDLGIKATYFTYDLSKALHKPKYTLEFLAKYNLRNKVIANLDIMGIGERNARAFFNSDKEVYILKRAIAFNLGVEYRYTRSFSLFLKLNNISGATYERWNFYPSYRFNMMGGFTYSL